MRAAKSDIIFSYAGPETPWRRKAVVRSVEAVSGRRRLHKLYNGYEQGRFDHLPDDFFEAALELLKLDVRFNATPLGQVPREGPVLFVANHPYGVLDGILLTWLMRQVRPDGKTIANDVLCQAPRAKDYLFPISFAGTKEATESNVRSRNQALEYLSNGGAVGIFPAGGVAASMNPLQGPAVDTPWHSFTAKLVRKTGATVVPIYFAGQNSRAFQIASHWSYTLRLALFFHETARRMGSLVELAVGNAINTEELADFDSRGALTRELRRRTYALAEQTQRPKTGYPSFDTEFAFPSRIRF